MSFRFEPVTAFYFFDESCVSSFTCSLLSSRFSSGFSHSSEEIKEAFSGEIEESGAVATSVFLISLNNTSILST